jgi:hypothetical protein
LTELSARDSSEALPKFIREARRWRHYPRVDSVVPRGLFARCALLALALQACAASPDEVDTLANPNRCTLPASVSGAPRDIEEVVTMVNALPKPTSIACFVEALERPLRMKAVHSVFSAQPATSERSPRFFIFLDPLIMTVVPEGIGRQLLELSVLQRDRSMSLKGEIVFPVTETIGAEYPYAHIEAMPRGSVCGLCHRDEVRSGSITFATAYVSRAYRPRPQDDEVPLPQIDGEARDCDRSVDPERCDVLRALFGGAHEEQDFPAEMAVCFE